jgi:hypothetical protein
MQKYKSHKTGYAPKRQYNRKHTKRLATKINKIERAGKDLDEGLVRKVIRESLDIVYRGYDNFAEAYDHITQYQTKHGRTVTGAILGNALAIGLQYYLNKK